MRAQLVRVFAADYNHPVRRFKDTSFLLFCVVVLGFVLRIDYFVSTPQWSRYHDIGDHMGYVNYVQQHWNIPSQSSNAGSEFHQPPLFYYIGAVLHGAGERAGLAHDDFIVVRMFELICSLIVVVLLAWVGSLLFSRWFHQLLFLASAVTFPGFIFPCADVNNDILLQLFGVLSFGFLLRWWMSGKQRDALYLSLAVTAAIMTKLTAMLFLFIIVAPCFRPHMSRADRIRQSKIFTLPLVVLCAYLIWRSVIERGAGANIIFFESMLEPLIKASIYTGYAVIILMILSVFVRRLKRLYPLLPLALCGALFGYLSWILDGRVFGFFLLLLALLTLSIACCEHRLRKRLLSLGLAIVVILMTFVGFQTFRLEQYRSASVASSDQAVAEWGPDTAPYRYIAFNPVRVLDHYLHPQWIGPMTDRFWEYVFKSAYTGEWDFGPRMFGIVRAMWGLGMLLGLLALLGVWEEFRKPSKVRLPVLVVGVTWMLSILAYHLYVPTYWNQDFRLVSLLVLPCMYLVVRGSGRWKGFFGIAASAVILLHAAICTSFFMALLWGW